MVTITFINCFKIPKSSAVVVRFAFKSLDLVLCISMIISTTACLMEMKLAFLMSRTNRKCFVGTQKVLLFARGVLERQRVKVNPLKKWTYVVPEERKQDGISVFFLFWKLF